MIAEEDIELFADIDGLTKICFNKENIIDAEAKIKTALKNSHRKAKEYFNLK